MISFKKTEDLLYTTFRNNFRSTWTMKTIDEIVFTNVKF